MKYLALTGLLILSGCSYKVPKHTLRIICVDSAGETVYVRFADEIQIEVNDSTLISMCEIHTVPRR